MAEHSIVTKNTAPKYVKQESKETKEDQELRWCFDSKAKVSKEMKS